MSTVGGGWSSPKIIRDGLVLYLDASSPNSYNPYFSATSWKDLSGQSNTGTLVNSPTHTASPGYFTFASNKYATTTKTNIALSSATFIAWVYPTQGQVAYTGIIFNRNGFGGSTVAATGLDFYNSNAVGYHWADNILTYNWNSGLLVPNNTWSMVAVSITSTAATAYLCQSSGITTATNTTSHVPLSGLNFYIGCDPTNTASRAVIGNMASVMVYNKALLSSDITTTYNATKTRFGL